MRICSYYDSPGRTLKMDLKANLPQHYFRFILGFLLIRLGVLSYPFNIERSEAHE